MSIERFTSLGLSVIPVYPRSKRPTIAWHPYQEQVPTAEELASWFGAGSPYNAAVVCGGPRGLTVLDFDRQRTYRAWLRWAAGDAGAREAAEATYRVRTARGIHVYLFVADRPGCHQMGRGRRRDGKLRTVWGDVKGEGGLAMIPPSVHPTGVAYRAMDESAPIVWVASLAEVLPELVLTPACPDPTYVVPARVVAASSFLPAGLIGDIKGRLDITSLVGDAHPSGDGGRWLMAHCPLHDDASESFWIDTARGLCGCFSGCTPRPLDVIGLYARLHGLTNREAIRQLTGQVT